MEPNLNAPTKPSGITLVWRRGFGPMRQSAEQLGGRARASNLWRCPVCSVSVARPHRAGRTRVYCTNACRQRAYRWRCAHRSELVTPLPPQRAQTSHRSHAVRSDADFVGRPLAPDGRRVAICGTFARVARDRPASFKHTNFYAIDDNGHPSRSTCQTCVTLLSVPLRPLVEILDEINSLDHGTIAA